MTFLEKMNRNSYDDLQTNNLNSSNTPRKIPTDWSLITKVYQRKEFWNWENIDPRKERRSRKKKVKENYQDKYNSSPSFFSAMQTNKQGWEMLTDRIRVHYNKSLFHHKNEKPNGFSKLKKVQREYKQVRIEFTLKLNRKTNRKWNG